MATSMPVAKLEDGVSLRATTVSKEVQIKLAVCTVCREACVVHRLTSPRRIAVASDTSFLPMVWLRVDDDVLKGASLQLGQDATFGVGRAAPGGESVGEDEATLRAKVRALVPIFASDDPDGKAARIVEAFLAKRSAIEMYSDPTLDRTIEGHRRFNAFADLALSAPGTPGADAHKVRIHQGLKSAGFDVEKVKTLTDLGVPAFNVGNKVLRTDDWGNGLALMIDGVQYVFVTVKDYEYYSCQGRYTIELEFALYDVFGLDDVDLRDLGAANTWRPAAMQGITAWWQLQHQFGYAPMLTRAVARKTFTVLTEDG